jgi:hypothetical protein
MANKYGKSAPHPCHKGNANSIPPQWEWLPSRSQTDVGRMSPVPCWWGCKSVHHYGIRMEESPRKLKYDCLWSRLPLLEGVQRTVSQATIKTAAHLLQHHHSQQAKLWNQPRCPSTMAGYRECGPCAPSSFISQKESEILSLQDKVQNWMSPPEVICTKLIRQILHVFSHMWSQI